MNLSSEHRGRAKALLAHYLEMAIEEEPGPLCADNYVEIDEIVDYIIRAAVAEVRAEFDMMYQEAQIREATRRMTEGPR